MRVVSRRPKGLFITLEGGEGSGKTTQALHLCRSLTAKGYDVLHTREPGGTTVAEQLRRILLDDPSEPLAAETEALLILAARRQHVDHVIRPALKRGAIVVCDRFSDSTFAYQGYGRGLDLKALRRMNDWATGQLSPHLTILFDLPVARGLQRRRGTSSIRNRLDRETRAFHARVHAGFHALAKREPRRIVVVDARPSPDIVAAQVETLVLAKLRRSHFKKDRKR
ncbi:MAG: dTMP kinase [Nitrospira sp.]|nr:dTMP kinase [Nitrospira sp.]MCP9442435.1 dTMP kinase [Nitrospira sp.]